LVYLWRAVDVAGRKRATFQIAELVEQKQRMGAGAGMPFQAHSCVFSNLPFSPMDLWGKWC
jgi:hypothetical protein